MTHANTVAFKDLNDAFENVAMSGKENGFSQEQILKALDDAINPEIADSASQNEAFKTLIDADKVLLTPCSTFNSEVLTVAPSRI